VYDLNLSGGISGSVVDLVASLKTTARFASVGWGPYRGDDNLQQYPLGLVAGGMSDGTVLVWDASALVENGGRRVEPLFTIAEHESGAPISALAFHPMEPWKLATGSGNGGVLVADLSGPVPAVTDPTGGSKQSAEITAVAWNSQVSHILATASRDGTVGVWDLKQKKAWCKLQVENGAVVDVAWNPAEGLHLLTASGDDRNPVLKVWDLGASTSMPLTTMTGHSAGILDTAWCPHDDTLLLSCAKDNRTLLWDLVRLQAVAELPPDTDGDTAGGVSDPNHQQQATPTQLFASSSLSEQKHMRVVCAWSPLKRGLALTCSLDRKVQVHSILSLATQSGRPPKWLRPASAVTTGFGGTIVSVGANDRVATIRTVQEQPLLVQKASAFEAEVASTNMLVFCENRRAACRVGSSEEKMWGFMRVIFEENARQNLLEHLGYDASQIAQAASHYKDDGATNNGVASLSLEDSKPAHMNKAAEEVVRRALIVGNFEAAVACCFKAGNLSDALLLAFCGGTELWATTQQRYFEKESAKRPYLSLLCGIVGSKLEDLVAQSDPSRWQETLAILASYGQSDEFPKLCIALGDRLESVGDAERASFCYMCALSVENATKYWISEYEAARKKSGSHDLMALHELVVKVTVFMKAAGPNASLPPNVADLFYQYSNALAEQGAFVSAAKYCKGTSMESMILRDRLYRSRSSQACLAELGSAPEFPFTSVAVSKSRASVISTRTSAASTQSNMYGAQRRQHTQSRASYASQPDTYKTSSQYSQQQSYASHAPSQPQGDQLPPGWAALQDPSSGRTYYANQSTGESSWEKPQMAPAPAAPQPTGIAHAAAPRADDNASQHSTASRTSKTAKLVSRYGDGFVTSSSHPELADRYGNVGTSNPYSVTRPGTAAAVVRRPSSEGEINKAPESGPVDIHAVELSAEHEQIKANLVALYDYLQSIASHSEQRQLDEAKKGIEALVKKLMRNEIDQETEANLVSMITAISNHDFRTATSITTELVNHEWKVHKDWLKGIKLLLQLAAKKV